MKSLYISLLIFLGYSLFAQDEPKTITSKIESVKLFFDGAQVNRNCSFQADAGTNKYIVKGLSAYINVNSIQAKCPNAVILGVEYRFNYLDAEKNSEEIRILLAKREETTNQMQVQGGLADVYKKEENMILQNQSIRGEQNGVQIAELKAASDFFRLRLTEIRQKQTEISNKIKALQKEYSNYDDQLGQVRSREETVSGEIIITIAGKTARQLELNLSYFTNNASWKATYDLRMNDVSQPLTLVRKADIQQNTGEKWDKVKFTLSTGTPSYNHTKPTLLPWYVSNQQPFKSLAIMQNPQMGGNGALKGKVKDAATGEAIPFANIIIENNGQQVGGSTSDFDGNFTIKPIIAGIYDLKVSFLGYQSVLTKGLVIKSDKITFYDIPMEATTVNLENFIVRDYKVPMISKDKTSTGGTVTSECIAKMPNRSVEGVAATVGGVFSRDSENDDFNSRVEKRKAELQFTSNNRLDMRKISGSDSELKKIDQSNFEYIIEEAQNLPSNGKNTSLIIEEKQMPAIYEYQCVPKLDKTAFLIARVSSWEDYQLISGDINLYFEGTFLGKSYLDVNTTSDTLNLSLGRDPNVVIERKKVKDRSSIQLLGNNRKIERSWEINIRNNKRNAVNLVIEDQYPLSNNSDVKVDLANSGNAKVDENKGLLTWKLRLEPAETKKLEFSYQIKAPSSYSLWIE